MSAPYATPVEVVQAALHRVGEATIASLNDGSLPAQIAASNYEGIVGDFLTRHAWTFSTRSLPLTYVGASTVEPWPHEFSWPTQVINIRQIRRGGRTLEVDEFDIQDDRVLTLSTDALQVVATIRQIESRWPADFSEAMVVRLEALFMEGLLEKPQDARLKEKDSEAKLLRAMTRDKRQGPAKHVERNRLAQVWRGLRSTSR